MIQEFKKKLSKHCFEYVFFNFIAIKFKKPKDILNL